MFNAHMSQFSGERVIAQGAHIGSTLFGSFFSTPEIENNNSKLIKKIIFGTKIYFPIEKWFR